MCGGPDFWIVGGVTGQGRGDRVRAPPSLLSVREFHDALHIPSRRLAAAPGG